MTISNRLTILRMCLIPLMIIVLYIPPFQEITTLLGLSLAELLFGLLFVVGSLTDIFDGYLARKRNEVTDFGKFLDPIADKLLTMTGMIYVVIYKTDYDFWWILLLIVIAREFIVSATRMVAANKNIVIAASVYGKVKTTITLIAIIIILFNGFGLYLLLGDSAHYITDAIFYVSVIITVLSGVDYIVKNRQVFVTNDN
ncbi:MAG: CDP-diacylglycerol--glycerol-3-phosphate 3-phosphatidyltransferase [Acholeplasmataceae bacterium]|nr:CDP-diacylglycerol--glycerol-3-phosphate 3-phosphatidyltransferase [Acholeplasmataceae bacterium]